MRIGERAAPIGKRTTLVAALTGAALGVVGCPASRMPTGPAPVYEEPQAPSWSKDGGAEQNAAPPPSIAPTPDGGTS